MSPDPEARLREAVAEFLAADRAAHAQGATATQIRKWRHMRDVLCAAAVAFVQARGNPPVPLCDYCGGEHNALDHLGRP